MNKCKSKNVIYKAVVLFEKKDEILVPLEDLSRTDYTIIKHQQNVISYLEDYEAYTEEGQQDQPELDREDYAQTFYSEKSRKRYVMSLRKGNEFDNIINQIKFLRKNHRLINRWSMVGILSSSLFKKVNLNLFTIHCIIHMQHLVAKNISYHLHTPLNLEIKAVNKIKRHGLQTRLFKELCNVNEKEFDNIILHT